MGRSRYGYQAALTGLLLLGISPGAVALGDTQTFDRCETMLRSAPSPSNVASIFAQLKQERLTKSEYETSAEYADRMSKLNTGRQMALVARVKADAGHYDADHQQLIYSKVDLVDAMDISAVDKDDRSKFTYAFSNYSSRDVGSYTGQNAFGARTRVTAATRSHLYIDAFDSSSISKFEPISLAMSPTQAKTARARLEWIAIGSIDPVTYRKSEGFYEATLDNPVQIAETNYLVTMKTVCIGLRDAKSHAILATFPALNSL